MPKTRKDSSCPVFGGPENLKDNVLPTYKDIIKGYLWVRNDLMWLSNGKDPSVKDICEIIANDVIKLWNKASIPIISRKQIISRLTHYYHKYKQMKKYRVAKNKTEFYEDATRNLFDIATCKCIWAEFCKCSTKIPKNELEFLKDQRGSRKMYIGSIDIGTTKVLERRQLRLKTKNKFLQKQSVLQTLSISPETIMTADTSDDSISLSDSNKDPDFHTTLTSDAPLPSTSKIQPNQMRHRLENLATACDRTGVSDRSASIIASAVLQDVGLISKRDSSKVIDRSKLRRERRKVRQDLQSSSLVSSDNKITGLYFDGRKDRTIIQEKRGIKYYRKTITEEHIVMLSEPGSQYIGHVTPLFGTAISIKKA